jgi:ankyrin repeat protein
MRMMNEKPDDQVDLREQETRLDTELYTAATQGDLQEVVSLLAKGADPLYRNSGAFANAVWLGHVSVAEALLVAIAEIRKTDDQFLGFLDKAVCFAASLGDVSMLRLLVKYGADVNLDGGYPLRLAEEEGHDEAAQFLKSAGGRSLNS